MQKLKQDLSIGENIRKIRLASGLTQEQAVAQLQVLGCNISRGTYAKIEAGLYNIRISELLSMAHIFHVTVDKFFENLSI